MQDQTFSLKICFKSNTDLFLYESVKGFLSSRGFDEFSEGYQNVDLMPDEVREDTNYFADQNYEIEVFRYCQKELEELSTLLSKKFSDIKCSISSFLTADWQEAWKDSFKPIYTKKFYIYPPWEKPSGGNLLDLMIEPGMAFGTGQHQTTKLCLQTLESMPLPTGASSLIDAGTGTGILAIAAAKLGYRSITATDIDQDAIRACKENQKLNNVSFESIHGSLPTTKGKRYSIVVANILANTILEMLGELVEICDADGYVIMSGILLEQSEEIIKESSLKGLTHIKTEEEDGWVALLFKKNV